MQESILYSWARNRPTSIRDIKEHLRARPPVHLLAEEDFIKPGSLFLSLFSPP